MGRLAYLGPEGTFTHQAARDFAGPDDELMPLRTAPAVVRAVDQGDADAGVVAFENSLEGPVTANLDEILAATRVVLGGERILAVSFCLFRAAQDDGPLTGVVSHPFGLIQCGAFIQEHGLATREATSTAAAAREVAESREPGWGAIAPRIAGDLAGLRLEREGIEDSDRAATRFVLLRRSSPAPSGRDRSAFAFVPRRDEPGSLVRLLQEFSVRGINLTTIKSRPTKMLLGDYVFFIECEGHITDPHVRDAVIGLLRFPGETRFLGSFPEDSERPPHPLSSADADAEATYDAMLRSVERPG
jgi:prephenate dehydratase